MSSDDKESFDKLDKKFNTDFDDGNIAEHVENIENRVGDLKAKKELMSVDTTEIMENQNYIEMEMKMLIEETQSVMKKLRDEIKRGSTLRAFEAYSQLSSSLMMQLRELRVMSRGITDLRRMKNNGDERGVTNLNIKMTGKEFFKMMKNIKEQNETSRVDADFDVVSQEVVRKNTEG